MAEVKIRPAKCLRGTIAVPGDKSISHRAIMLGSLAKGTTRIEGLLQAEDSLATSRAFEAMGVRMESLVDGSFLIRGVGLFGLREPKDILNVSNSATTMRLMLGILAGQKFYSVITGDQYLRTRPMGRVVEPLSKMGAQIWGREGGKYAPLSIKGRELQSIFYELPLASAQVKSALLLAGLHAQGMTKVRERVKTRDHTERMLRFLGAEVSTVDLEVAIKGGVPLEGGKIKIPGDFSSAAFFIVAATILEDSDISILNVGINPTRIGLLEVLREMGAQITIFPQGEEGGEPIGHLRVKGSKLKGVSIPPQAIPRMIDELPIIAVAAARAEGITAIRGASELRVKETDRIKAMVTELKKMGLTIEELEDGMIIEGGGKLKGALCESYWDHRVAMSLAIAGLLTEGETSIRDFECVNTSFPQFLELLNKLIAA